MNPSSLLVALAVAGCVVAEKVPEFVTKGKCPLVDEQSLWAAQKPQLSRFGGTWFQYAMTTNPYQSLDQCVRLQYDFNGSGFDAKSVGITAEGNLMKMQGEIAPMPLGDPHLMVAFQNSFPAPLVILDTDYQNYACLYSCVDFNSDYHTDFAFVFSRIPTPSNVYLTKCETAFKNIGIDTSRFLKTVQGSRCPYDTLRTLL